MIKSFVIERFWIFFMHIAYLHSNFADFVIKFHSLFIPAWTPFYHFNFHCYQMESNCDEFMCIICASIYAKLIKNEQHIVVQQMWPFGNVNIVWVSKLLCITFWEAMSSILPRSLTIGKSIVYCSRTIQNVLSPIHPEVWYIK